MSRRRLGLRFEVWFACLPMIVCLFASGRSQNKRFVTIEKLGALKSPGWQMEVSPNGESLAYDIDGDLWLIATKRGSGPRKIGKGTMPHWSPDGRRLAFYSSVSSTLQLWVMDTGSGELTQVTKLEGGLKPDARTRFTGWVGDPLRYDWSPDSSKIVFTSKVQLDEIKNGPKDKSSTGTSPLIFTSRTPASWSLIGVFRAGDYSGVGYTSKGGVDFNQSESFPTRTASQIFVARVSSKEVEQLTKDEAQYFNPSWAPNGKEIMCASVEGRSLIEDSDIASNLYILEAATGRKTALTSGPGIKRLPYWSPDGRWIAYLGSERFGLRSVYVMPSEGGEPTNISAKLDRSVLFFYWAPDSKALIVSALDGVSWPIVEVNSSTGSFRRLTQGEAVFWPFTVSKSGALVWALSDGSNYKVIQIWVPDDKTYTLLNLNPQIREWALGAQRVIKWKNSQGENLEGILIKPVGYQEGRKYPLIIDPYGGRANSFMGDTLLANQTLAAKGYAIFFPNHRAHHIWMNYMKNAEYSQVARGAQGGDIMLDDILSGVDALAKDGIADPDRLCLYGFSNGATAVSYLLTRTSRFKCAVSTAGSGDWTLSYFLETDIAHTSATMAGRTPWDDSEAYVKLSPIYHLDKVTTPVLLVVGDKDTPDRLLNYVAMFNGLRRLGRDVTLVRYPEQGHIIEGSAIFDYWNRIYEFFDAHLKP